MVIAEIAAVGYDAGIAVAEDDEIVAEMLVVG